MGELEVLELGRNAITTGLLLSAPMLLAGLVAGLVVSILLAATQIQEFTLSFIPKVLVMVGAALLCGPWMLRQMTTFTADIITRMAQVGH